MTLSEVHEIDLSQRATTNGQEISDELGRQRWV